MVRNLALFLLIALPTLAFAQLDSQFNFNGQNAEIIKAQKPITVITPEVVEVPSTCTRQVPDGQEQVCTNQIRYRQECSWIPSSERCWNENQDVCRPVTRTREECTGRENREVCSDQPGREVCTQKPSREICRPGPNGGRTVCVMVSAGRDCRIVGGGRTCHTVPGNRQCRMISEVVNDCRTISNRRCEHIPGRTDCRDISYYEPVCIWQTRYRTESYACTRTDVVQRRTSKILKNEINVRVNTNGLVEEFGLGISVKEQSQAFDAFSIEASLMNQPNVLVLLKKKEIKIAQENDKEIILKSTLVLEVVEERMIAFSFPEKISRASIDKNSEKLIIIFEGAISADGAVDLELTHKTLIFPTKTLAELKTDYPGPIAELGQVDNKAALNLNLKGLIQGDLKPKNMKINLKLISKIDVQGQILNEKKPQTKKSYEGIPVSLK